MRSRGSCHGCGKTAGSPKHIKPLLFVWGTVLYTLVGGKSRSAPVRKLYFTPNTVKLPAGRLVVVSVGRGRVITVVAWIRCASTGKHSPIMNKTIKLAKEHVNLFDNIIHSLLKKYTSKHDTIASR